MSLVILIRPIRSAIELLPLKNGSNTASFTGNLVLRQTPKGPRPFKFRVIDGKTEDRRPPTQAVELLRMADLILVAGYGDAGTKKEIIEMLDGYQLGYEQAQVCRLCISHGRYTPVDSGSVRFRGELICENCALSELHREIQSCSKRMTEEGIERLFAQLLRTRDLDRMLVLLDPKKMDRELTLFDRVRASGSVTLVKVHDLELDKRLKSTLPETLLPVQSISIGSGLLDRKNQLVVSATATGKTLIGEIGGVSNILSGRGKMLFLVPLVALANQKYDQFTKKYSPLGLTTALKVGQSRIGKGKKGKGKQGKMRTSIDSDIIVGTYEGIDHLLRLGDAKRLGSVGTVVMDEVHMIEDPERGPRLDGLIARLRHLYPQCQFIYLSATVGNPGWLADALGSKLVEYEERPVPLERHLLFGGPSEKLRLINQLVKEEYNRKSSKGFRGQTIVFTNSRRNCHKLSDALQIRAAAYHGGLPYSERRRIEEGFASGRIPVVVTTAALAAGVDFPASQVIFEGLTMGIEWLKQGEFLQMQGRAGRPDYHDRGIVVVMAEPGKRLGHGESEDHVAFRLLKGEVPPLTVGVDEDAGLEQVLASAIIWGDRHIIRTVDSMRLGGTDTDQLIGELLDRGYLKVLGQRVSPTLVGRIMSTYFLNHDQLSIIKDGINSGLEPVNILAGLDVFDQAFFTGADRISASLNVRLPSRVFQGGAMEMALSGDSLAKLDSTTARKLMNFATDFLTCTCKDSPYCGCPERKFSGKLLDMRCEGMKPVDMIEFLTQHYGIFAYPADVLEYLETSSRHLEAIRKLAKGQGKLEVAEQAGKLFKCIVG
jgi:putative ATP-dependent RNA helicase